MGLKVNNFCSRLSEEWTLKTPDGSSVILEIVGSVEMLPSAIWGIQE